MYKRQAHEGQIAASDLTLMRNDLTAAVDAIRLSRRTLSTIKVNLFWAFAYNVAAIPLAALGLLNPLVAGLTMAFSSVFVVTKPADVYLLVDVIDPAALPSFEDWFSPSGDGLHTRYVEPAPAGPPLTELLTDAIGRFVGDADARDKWLTIAGTVADARINAIVSGKHRGAYARAASLAYSHAEALAGVGRDAQARTYLEGVRSRFPRHVAFRAEFDAAGGASTLRPRRR